MQMPPPILFMYLICFYKSEMYSELSQISFSCLLFSQKTFILDVWQSSEYTSAIASVYDCPELGKEIALPVL